jgi:hypothetical protein
MSHLEQLCKWLLVQQVLELQVRGWLEQVQLELVLLEQPRQKKALRPDRRGSSLHW